MTLPFIDAHETTVDAPPEVVWDATALVLAGMGGPLGPPGARVLGCTETRSDFPHSVPGFRVRVAERPTRIALSGEHRFSSYALEFTLRPLGDGTTALRAETRAAFPGTRGRLYRALVIGSRAHVVATRRLLSSIKRRAEAG